MTLTPSLAQLEISRRRDPSVSEVLTDGVVVVERSEINASPWDCRLIIKRIDGQAFKSWRQCQDIKNAVVGSDRTAIEVYPPESEVIDTAHTYHLWVCQPGQGPGVSLRSPTREAA